MDAISDGRPDVRKMETKRVKLFVVAHKPFEMLEGEALVPIHVGRVASRLKDEMAGMIGDDTGVNISEKNPSYCEMTAHYWIWKNIHDTK